MKYIFTILFFFCCFLSQAQNPIYNAGDTLNYSIFYQSDSIVSHDTIQLIITGDDWETQISQQKAIYLYEKMEHAPSYFAGLKSLGWVYSDTTGIVDDSTKCWIHPPRHHHLREIELSPFPRVHFPLEIGKKYALMLVIGDGWEELSFSQIMWNYEVVKLENDTWTINASATPQNKRSEINKLTFTFNFENGFTELNYEFHSGTLIKMNLLK